MIHSYGQNSDWRIEASTTAARESHSEKTGAIGTPGSEEECRPQETAPQAYKDDVISGVLECQAFAVDDFRKGSDGIVQTHGGEGHPG
jgi:hypothetical protein